MLKLWVTLDCPRFSKAFTRFNTILLLYSERLLHIQTCSRTNLQPATTNTKAVLRHPKICCCCWLCSWFYFSQRQKLSTAQLVLHPGLGWAHNPKWEAGRGSSAGALLTGSCCNSLTNHHISDLYSIPMQWECDSKAAQYDGKGDTKKPPELHENILMAVVTPAKEMKSNSKQTTLSFLYTQTINSPSCILAWWCHIYFLERK